MKTFTLLMFIFFLHITFDAFSQELYGGAYLQHHSYQPKVENLTYYIFPNNLSDYARVGFTNSELSEIGLFMGFINKKNIYLEGSLGIFVFVGNGTTAIRSNMGVGYVFFPHKRIQWSCNLNLQGLNVLNRYIRPAETIAQQSKIMRYDESSQKCVYDRANPNIIYVPTFMPSMKRGFEILLGGIGIRAKYKNIFAEVSYSQTLMNYEVETLQQGMKGWNIKLGIISNTWYAGDKHKNRKQIQKALESL
jgi:hypothetical protein